MEVPAIAKKNAYSPKKTRGNKINGSSGMGGLPAEVWVNIFSFLNKKERQTASTVSKGLNSVFFYPSFWKIKFIEIGSKTKLSSFCRFYNKVPFLQRLSLQLDTRSELSQKEYKILNDLLGKFNYIQCLYLGVSKNIPNLILPPTLNHLSFRYTEMHCKNISSFQEFDIVNCLNLEHLCLARDCIQLGNQKFPKLHQVGEYFLTKFETTLTSLFLTPFQKEWLPLIANCSNLKELGVIFRSQSCYNVHIDLENPDVLLQHNDLEAITKLPQLQVLKVDYIFWRQFVKILNSNKLMSVNNLYILNIFKTRLGPADFYYIRNSIPKLELFHIREFEGAHFYLLHFLKNTPNIKHFCYETMNCNYNVIGIFMDKVYGIHEERPFESICFCSILYSFWRGKLKSKLPRYLKKCNLFFSRECSLNVEKTYVCQCLFQPVDPSCLQNGKVTWLKDFIEERLLPPE